MLKEKVKTFLEMSGTPKTVFCQRVGVSPMHFYAWLRGERNLSDELAGKIEHYINAYASSFNSFNNF